MFWGKRNVGPSIKILPPAVNPMILYRWGILHFNFFYISLYVSGSGLQMGCLWGMCPTPKKKQDTRVITWKKTSCLPLSKCKHQGLGPWTWQYYLCWELVSKGYSFSKHDVSTVIRFMWCFSILEAEAAVSGLVVLSGQVSILNIDFI